MKTYVHPATHKTLEAYSVSKPHAVLISGPRGVGLHTIAHSFAKQLNGLALVVSPPEGAMTVETVRSLYDIAKTKTTQRRCIIIDAADSMSHQAQNALLKLLEEPVDETTFMLLSHVPGALLSTIRSRTQHIEVHPIPDAMTEAMLNDLRVTNDHKRTQLLFIARGLPAALTLLSQDEEAFEARVSVVRDARTYIQARRYERLLIALRYADDRSDAQVLIEDALRLLERSVTEGGDARIIRRIEQLTTVYERLTQNGNVRLQLTAGVV